MGKVIGAVLGVFVFLIVITVLFGSWYTVDEGERAVLAANGALVDLTKAERWDGKLPSSMIPGSAVPFLDVGARP